MLNESAARAGFALILIAAISLAIGFSLGPIFEPHDEIEHYRYIRYIADTGALPPANGRMHSQYHQAPLYYMLLAPVASLLPDRSAERVRAPAFNPNQKLFVLGNDNPNIFAHTRAEAFPYTGSRTAHAVHVLRLGSVLMHAATVIGTFFLACLLWPERTDRQIITMAIVAFWPTLLGLAGAINNDALLFPLAVWSVVQALRLSGAPSWKKAFTLGVLLGAAMLTKIFAAVLAVPVGYVFLTNRPLWRYLPVVIAAALAVCGWWFIHNTANYGDPLAVSATLETWPDDVLVTDEPPILHGLRMAHTQAYSRLWAKLGHGAVGVNPWMYTAFDILLLTASAGGIIAVVRAMNRWRRTGSGNPFMSSTFIITLWLISTYLLLVYFASTRTYGAQGRYLLMSLPAMAALITIGLDTWLGWIPAALKTAALTAFPGVVATIILTMFFLPAYRALPVPAVIERPLALRYEQTAELIGMSPADLDVRAGEPVTIELYWRALGAGSSTLQSYLHGIGAEAFLWADSLPGNGHLLSSDWETGETWAERYTFDIPADVPVGTEIVLTAGLYDPASNEALIAYGPNGENLSNTPGIGVLRVADR